METMTKPSRRRSSISVSKPRGPCNKAVNFSTRFSLKAFVKRVDKLTQSQKEAIIRTGFGKLLLIGNHMMSKNLLVELMERWHPQKQAFVLKGEIIRITPMDVALILGLRVAGKYVNVVSGLDLPFVESESRYGATLWNRKINVGSIEERLEALGENDDADFVRLFLLFTFGTILFPNTTGKVDSRYLCFLQDLDGIDKFAWGAAVLEDLVYWLSKRKEINVQYVGGCLILLQVWSYEHIDIARPSPRNQPIRFPRACRWDNSKSHKRDWFIMQFRNLKSNQLSWNLDLTPEELELEIVKELLVSEREMVTTHIDLEPQADGALANEIQNTDVISISSDVSDNQIGGVLANVRTCQQVSQKGYSDQLRPSCDLALTSMRDQHSSQPACCSPQGKQYQELIATSDVNDNQGDGVLANNDCSKEGDQCSSPSTSCSPQLMQKHNIIDLSSDDNEERSTSEYRVMEQAISKLKMENNNLKKEMEEKDTKLSETSKIEENNLKLRKEVETLKQQNMLHLSAFNVVNRLNDIVFSKIADELLGTNISSDDDATSKVIH